MATEQLTRRKFSPKLRVEITQDRIVSSVQRSSSHCMIAEALRDMLPPTIKRISVDLYTAAFTDTQRNLRFSYELPRSAQLALIAFDRGEVPEPFSFTLQRARKIIRRREYKTVQTDKDHSTYDRKRHKARAANTTASTQEVIAALNDPTAPLHGPFALPGNEHEITTIIGGRPTPMSNFAKERRFGLKRLAS